ncbi:guanylate kinase [Gaiella sp.]|jgi:guanylate kinase|uniref:guanylate kinase n=1 Tax=Gaiella sp. TaxID=2663207 RepID=UPI002E34CFFC|nr:guanylate kinase [Gaiella sp.]HEX5583647.1 guanylate kinase [Gaiella sp.]
MAAPVAPPPAIGMGDSAPVFVVTGPSGAGKGTLIRALLERIPELEVAVSATTRTQRPGEVDGREYWFLSDEEFTRRDEAGGFLEWVEYVSHKRYGTLRSEIDRIAERGRVCVLELELEGALRVQEETPGACTIFIAADVAELERRLRERATESTGEIEDRITIARYQLEQAHRFRYMVRNDDVLRASEVLAAIVERELALAAASSPLSGRE